MLIEEYLFYTAVFVLILGIVGVWIGRKNKLVKISFFMVAALSLLLGFFALREYQIRIDNEKQIQEQINTYQEQLRKDSIEVCEKYIALAEVEAERFKKATFPSETANTYVSFWEVYKIAKKYCITEDQKRKLDELYNDREVEYKRKMRKMELK